MIPLKLQIKNFLSYGPEIETIDFKDYKLICLSGKNGHGKSALLDALTWAVWGQARKVGATPKPDQGLLHQGQLSMMVCFDFIFNGQTYRVKRDFSQKYGKPHTYIDFGLYNVQKDSFIPLTDKTTRKTQEVIETVLGLDYDTFINSSFLRQGQSNEFSKKSPKERKVILGTILGLNAYEKTRAFALEKARECLQEKNTLLALQEQCRQETEKVSSIDRDIELLEKELQTVENKQNEILSLKKKHQEELKQEEEKQQLCKALLYKESLQKEELLKKELFFTKTTKLWKDTHRKLLSLSPVTTIEQEKKELLQLLLASQKTKEELLTLKTALLEAEKKYYNRELILKNELEKKSDEQLFAIKTLLLEQEAAKKNNHKRKEEILLLEKEYELCTTKIDQLHTVISPDALMHSYEELEHIFEQKKALYHSFVEQGRALHQEQTTITSKQHLSEDQENPSCPLCEQNLSQARKRFLSKKFEQQTIRFSHRFERLKKIIPLLKTALEIKHTELKLLKELLTVTAEKNRLEGFLKLKKNEELEALQKIKEYDKELEEKKRAHENYNTTHTEIIETDTTLKELLLQITFLKKELSSLAYDEVLHQKTTARLQELETISALYADAEKERAAQEERKKNIFITIVEIKTIKKECKKIEEELTLYRGIEGKIITLKEATQRLEKEEETLIKERESLYEKRGSLYTNKEKKMQLEELTKTYTQEIKNKTETGDEFTTIAQALSKDGIQGLLIEETIPELEHEANQLLSKLTDNQATITIESLRDLKKGGTKETLDINISDSNGVRPYEMFSGGEAFRIDFALRIALSKLLAHRAGTSLQTLIIDEGFGSQDEEGLQSIMDVLHAIQNDFEKIIIVSHLPSMKEQFPVHFHVEKHAHTSHIHIKEYA